MTQKNRTSAEEKKTVEEGRKAKKKSYQKPGFRSERVFETMALNCGKTATQGQCRHNRRAS